MFISQLIIMNSLRKSWYFYQAKLKVLQFIALTCRGSEIYCDLRLLNHKVHDSYRKRNQNVLIFEELKLKDDKNSKCPWKMYIYSLIIKTYKLNYTLHGPNTTVR